MNLAEINKELKTVKEIALQEMNAGNYKLPKKIYKNLDIKELCFYHSKLICKRAILIAGIKNKTINKNEQIQIF